MTKINLIPVKMTLTIKFLFLYIYKKIKDMCSCKNKVKSLNNNPAQKSLNIQSTSSPSNKKKTREELLAELRARISGSTR